MVDNSSGGGGEVELNLAPIIDCFTVLITYLLVTASFISLTSLDVSVSASSDTAQAAPAPVDDKKPLVMTMDVGADNMIIVKVNGGDLKKEYQVNVPATGATWDEAALGRTLAMITNRWAKLSEVSVSAAPTVRYKELVNIINATQKSMPKVYISGT